MHLLKYLPSRPLVILAGLSLFVAYLSVQDMLEKTGVYKKNATTPVHQMVLDQ